MEPNRLRADHPEKLLPIRTFQATGRPAHFMTYYKWTAGDRPVHGTGSYDQSGAWMPKIDVLEMCVNGYHVCTREQLPYWCGTELWEVEVRGEHLEDDEKACWQELRFVRKIPGWNRGIMIEYAQWCAKQARATASSTAARTYAASRTYVAANKAFAAAANASAYAAANAYAVASSAAARAALYAADAASRAATRAAAAASAARADQLSWIEGKAGKL